MSSINENSSDSRSTSMLQTNNATSDKASSVDSRKTNGDCNEIVKDANNRSVNAAGVVDSLCSFIVHHIKNIGQRLTGQKRKLSEQELNEGQGQDGGQHQDQHSNTCCKRPRTTESESASNNSKTIPYENVIATLYNVDIIVQKIVSNLPTRDKLNLRLVSHRLHDLTTKNILTSMNISIKLYRSKHLPLDTFIKVFTPTRAFEGERNLKKLLLLMEDSTFPCRTFSISTNNLFDHRLLNLWTYHGLLIQTLHLDLFFLLDLDVEKNALNQLKHILKHLPSLTSLEVETRTQNYEFEELKTPHGIQFALLDFQLPNLRYLKADNCSKSTFEFLLKSASFLKEYFGHRRSFLSYFTEGDGLLRLHQVKRLCIKFSHDESESGSFKFLERISDLIENHPSLNIQIIYFEFHELITSEALGRLWGRAGQIISRLLQLCSNSLRQVYWQPVGFLEDLHLVQMPLVKELVFTKLSLQLVECASSYGYFQEGFGIEQMFPGLKSIIAYMPNEVGGLEFSSFIDGGVWERVEGIENIKFDHLRYEGFKPWRLFQRKIRAKNSIQSS